MQEEEKGPGLLESEIKAAIKEMKARRPKVWMGYMTRLDCTDSAER